MAKKRKAQPFSPGKKPKVSLPPTLKDEVDTKVRELVETVLKPRHIKPPPKDHQLNYLTDLTVKWLSCTPASGSSFTRACLRTSARSSSGMARGLCREKVALEMEE
jgi:hypothetical protein